MMFAIFVCAGAGAWFAIWVARQPRHSGARPKPPETRIVRDNPSPEELAQKRRWRQPPR